MMPTNDHDSSAAQERREPLPVAPKSHRDAGARAAPGRCSIPGTFRELLGPFDRLESPWLPLQGLCPSRMTV